MIMRSLVAAASHAASLVAAAAARIHVADVVKFINTPRIDFFFDMFGYTSKQIYDLFF